jgi:oxaloacetate decarboxylase gamma subunit
MDNIILEALQLLAVGMITVFLILMIVIYLGKGLILLVNKFAPEEVVVSKVVSQAKTDVDATTKAVIDAAVSQVTNGKGAVTKIEKI